MIASSYVNVYVVFQGHCCHEHRTFRESEATYKKRWWHQNVISCNVNLNKVIQEIISETIIVRKIWNLAIVLLYYFIIHFCFCFYHRIEQIQANR